MIKDKELNLWDVIKLFYKQNFNIPERVIDYISVKPILIKSLSGYSNHRIALSLNEDIEYIVNILYEFLKFDGWDEDLEFNPIATFNKIKGNLENYRQEVLQNSSITNIRLIDKTFYLCERYYKRIEREIQKYYGEN
jgi:hypothetical protein